MVKLQTVVLQNESFDPIPVRVRPAVTENYMGTWSHEPFGKDTAIDWTYELQNTHDFSLVEQAIQRVLDCGPEYVDADLAVEAVAAAEIIAKALGRGTQSDAYTNEVDAWLKFISAV